MTYQQACEYIDNHWDAERYGYAYKENLKVNILPENYVSERVLQTLINSYQEVVSLPDIGRSDW